MTLDIEGVLRQHETVATGLGEWCCKCSPMEWRPSGLRAAHVAAVLREQIEALADLGVRENWPPDEWRAALAAQVAPRWSSEGDYAEITPSRVPGTSEGEGA